MTQHIYFAVRLLFVGAWIYWGLTNSVTGPSMPAVAYIAALAWGAMLVRFLVFRFYTSKSRTAPWQRPSWRASPFSLSQPFQFLHLVGVSFVALAAATVLGVQPSVNTAAVAAVSTALMAGSFGAGILLGIYWAVWSRSTQFLPLVPGSGGRS
jgi:hypothetical protein